MASLERFFESRGAAVDHEVSPLADASALGLLNERGYAPIEFTSVMFRPLDSATYVEVPVPGRVRVELVDPGREQAWTDTAARGWSEHEGVAELMADLGRVGVRARGNACFLAQLGGEPIAAGALSIHEGTALLAGSSTVPEARRQGAQLALLEHRLRYAAEQGCDLAMMGAHPGSASQRNAERHGFRIAYTRIKWRRRPDARALSGA
jgi:GNAT superfamily N-acetyltransferase